MRWVAGGLILLVIGAWVLDFGLGAMQAAAGGRHAITVSYDTTRITEPLHPDGGVDYFAALNQQASEGVTPDNNAVVELLRAFGPAKIPRELRPAFFQMLGMEPLADEGAYFVYVEDYCTETLAPDDVTRDSNRDGWTDLDETIFRAEITPWTADASPQIVAWLNANQLALDRIVTASHRTRYYCPLVCKSTTPALMAIDTPTVYFERPAVRALATRAMLRLGSGDVEAAWQDALACHRLSRLVGQGPMLLDALRAFGLEGIAIFIDRAVLARTDVSAERLQRMLDDLAHLAPIPHCADQLDRADRFADLDMIQLMAAEGPGFAGSIADVDRTETATDSSSLNQYSALMIDYNAVMRTQNAWIDRTVAALRQPTWAVRRTAIQSMETEIDSVMEGPRNVFSTAVSFLGSPRRTFSEGMGQMMVSLSMVGVREVAEAEMRANVKRDLINVGFRLAQYRAEQGEYPKQLADLIPQYTAAIPMDPFADRPFVYRRQPVGFTLYSVGLNGEDDGGKGYRDYESDREVNAGEDDIVVRVPLTSSEREPQ